MTTSCDIQSIEAGWKAWRQQDWFQAHECWEEAWLNSSGALKHQLQALIQVAAALVHIEHGNLKGACSLAAKALCHTKAFANATNSSHDHLTLPTVSVQLDVLLRFQQDLERLAPEPDATWKKLQLPHFEAQVL